MAEVVSTPSVFHSLAGKEGQADASQRFRPPLPQLFDFRHLISDVGIKQRAWRFPVCPVLGLLSVHPLVIFMI